MNVLQWAKDHPLLIAGGVFFVGLLLLMGRGSGGGDGGMSAFYAAQAAQKQSGDAVMMAQIAANAQTTLGGRYFDAQENINNKWADTQYATAQANNATAVQLAPYQAQAAFFRTVSDIANAPPITQTTTQTKQSSGFFGIGAKNKTTTSTQVLPNPAWGFLDEFWDIFDFAGPNNPAQLPAPNPMN